MERKRLVLALALANFIRRIAWIQRSCERERKRKGGLYIHISHLKEFLWYASYICYKADSDILERRGEGRERKKKKERERERMGCCRLGSD
jgi:hypothetical protein